ncbi:MAG: hypothetical protein ABI867_01650 [Kofleriaceae bacterium]
MSYLHCPTCQRAYNVKAQPGCPSCGVRPGTPADPVASLVDAAEQLARAIERATPDQLVAAETALSGRLALADGSGPIDVRAVRSAPRSILAAVRTALAPPPPQGSQHALLATVALALLTRLTPPRVVTWSARARAFLRR